MTRDELVRAACLGDERARAVIGPWLSDQLRQFLAKEHEEPERINDLFQDTMVDVWTKIEQRNPASADELVSFVLGFAVTSSLRARSRDARGHRRQAIVMHHMLREPTPAQSPDSKLAQNQAIAIVERCLLEISTPIRDTLRWKLFAGRTLRQFAAERGIPEGTARTYYRRGRKQLGELLDREGLTPSQCGL